MQPRQVPPIAQQRQTFSRAEGKPIPPLATLGQMPIQPSPGSPVDDDEHDLALEIYARLVVGEYMDTSSYSAKDHSRLRELANSARTAARVYFESTEEQQNNG